MERKSRNQHVSSFSVAMSTLVSNQLWCLLSVEPGTVDAVVASGLTGP